MEVSPVPIEGRFAAVLLWIVGVGWGLSAPWLMWWVVVRGRLPVLPLIGEPNGGPFYLSLPHAVFVVLLGVSFVLGIAQIWAGWLLWNGERLGALVQFGLLPVEAAFWYGFAIPIPPLLAVVRVVLVGLAWSRLV
jgi:hypothetical protein